MAHANAVTSPTEVPRDQWGRPLVVPERGGKPVAYTRVSTLSKQLDNGNALAAWKQRMTALGLARRPDLMALVQSLDVTAKNELDQICEQALEHAGGTSRANLGTALHSIFEQADKGNPPAILEALLAQHLQSYRTAIEIAGLTPAASERFVVCDELQVAGTFDRIYRTRDNQLVIGDIKTGDTANTYGLGAVQIQTACYAAGRTYDPATGSRGPALSELGVSREWAVLVHSPYGSGSCTIYRLDLEQGWADAQLASKVHRRTAATRKWAAAPYSEGS